MSSADTPIEVPIQANHNINERSEPAPAPKPNGKGNPVDDLTMTYASGCAIFSVQGVRFKIAKGLLQQHSDVFSSMLDMNSPEEEVIILDDSIDAFREFRCVMYTPFLSCLMPNDTRTSSETQTLLGLLELSHKYCATHIEAMALNAAIDATKPGKDAYTHAYLLLPVLRVAYLVSSDELARPARARILHLLWASTRHPDSTIDPRSILIQQLEGTFGRLYSIDALRTGKSTGDTAIIGAAYYATMCQSNPPFWKTDNRLTALDRSCITQGMMRCAHEWQVLQNTWGTEGLGCHKDCHHKRNVLDASLRVQGSHQIEWYDILGKLSATQIGNSELGKAAVSTSTSLCSNAVAATITREMERVKEELYEYFCGSDSAELKDGK